MEIQVLETGLSLSGEAYIYNIEPLKQAFEDLFRSELAHIQVDMSQVIAIDTAVLQLLVSVYKSIGNYQKTITFSPVSDTVQRILQLTGLDMVLHTTT
ncbi:STAS domain-containing protein [Deltaproteobacteria bacterium TL4]